MRPAGPFAAEHLSDHGSLFRSSSAAASRRRALRMLSAAYGSKIVGTLPGGVQFRHRLVQVDADPADQPGGADQFRQRFAERSARLAALARAVASAAWAA